jgi:saccharopine dehydrogenase (NAD+, L-lysine-forming)
LAIKAWAHQLQFGNEPLPGVNSYTNERGFYEDEAKLLDQLRRDLQIGIEKAGRAPKVLVMGALVSELYHQHEN